MKRIKMTMLVIGCLMLYANVCFPVEYIVQEGESIEEAVNQAQPGDTVLVREGIYRETVNIKVNGTEQERITIKAYPDEKVILEGTEKVSGWTQCSSSQDLHGNPHWENIYYTYIDASAIDSVIDITFFEDGVYLQKAQDPDQSDHIVEQVSEFRPLEEESFGFTEYLIDTDFLTQPDDYWNGAWVKVWSHAANNVVILRRIADYIQSEHKIVFDEVLPHPISKGTMPDAYMIVNHPNVLDKPGEYYCVPTPDQDNKYKIFLWPRDVNHLDDTIHMSTIHTAVYINSGYGSYVTIEGFEIRFYSGTGTRSGGIICPYGFNHTNLIIRNNNVHDITGYAGICVITSKNDRIENNIVRNIRGVGRGIVATGENIRVFNNFVENTKSTCIYMPGAQNGIMAFNTVGRGGNHANAMAVYQGANNVLVACNQVYGAGRPFTLSTSSNITLFNNLFIGNGGYLVADWGGMSGTVTIVNNIVIGSNNNASVYVHSADNIIFKNNIVDGGGTDERSHNIYVDLSWSQNLNQGWELKEGEIIEKDLTKIFVDPDNDDYTLKEESPAIDAGCDITEYLPTEIFPDFDFQKYINSNTKQYGNDTWDIGSNVYGIDFLTPDHNPDPDPGPDPDPPQLPEPPEEPAEPHADLPDVTSLQVSNNIIKETENTSATIQCNLKEAGNLSVKIYDAKGRKIITLCNEHKEAGRYEFFWAGNDAQSNKVGSGIYIVHMKAGGYSENRKIAVIK